MSVATVSYVLNNGPRPVRPETRERVLAVMRRLDYHPNAMARGLVRRRMTTVGVLFGEVEAPVITNPYAAAVLQGILTASSELGYNITLFTQPWVDARRSAAAFRDRRTDGVVVVAPLLSTDMVAGLAALGLPMVVVSAPGLSEKHVATVDVDNTLGARLAAEHLLALGHTRIAHISGDSRHSSITARYAGFRAALDAAGVAFPDAYLREGSYSGHPRDGINAAQAHALLSLPEPPTAIFAGNDNIAVTVLEVARERGIRVPEELSVVGFDDIPVATMVTPPLTTVCQPLVALGKTATRLLVGLVEGKAEDVQTPRLLPPTLAIRATTAPPPLAFSLPVPQQTD